MLLGYSWIMILADVSSQWLWQSIRIWQTQSLAGFARRFTLRHHLARKGRGSNVWRRRRWIGEESVVIDSVELDWRDALSNVDMTRFCSVVRAAIYMTSGSSTDAKIDSPPWSVYVCVCARFYLIRLLTLRRGESRGKNTRDEKRR